MYPELRMILYSCQAKNEIRVLPLQVSRSSILKTFQFQQWMLIDLEIPSNCMFLALSRLCQLWDCVFDIKIFWAN